MDLKLGAITDSDRNTMKPQFPPLFVSLGSRVQDSDCVFSVVLARG